VFHGNIFESLMIPNKIPVIVLTGFLGSGKTTLLNRLLADGVKTAVVINEFGNTPVDQDLLADQTLPMTVLSGGCLCCQIKGALAPSLKNLWMAWNNADVKPFDRLIIETSGVASPEPVIDTLLRDAWLAKRYALQDIVTTLAIPFAAEQLARYFEAQSQVIWADTLLLTHADLAQADQLDALSKSLSRLAPATPKLTITTEHIDPATLLDKALPAFRRLPTGVSVPDHRFRSLLVYLERTPSWAVLHGILQRLLALYGSDLVRIKGVVYPPELTMPLVVHATGRYLYPPQPLPMDNVEERRSRLVLIATSDIRQLADELVSLFSAYLDRTSFGYIKLDESRNPAYFFKAFMT
jgi:G3E family GTPase